jgi:hypothetical protein
MASLSEPTKKTASSLTNKVSKVMDKIVGGRTTPVESEKSPAKLLGAIYELMVKMDEDKRLHEELQQTYDKEDASSDKHRHEELIKALTGRRKKPEIKKEVKEKKEEVKKEPETKTKAPETKTKAPETKTKAPETKTKAPEVKVAEPPKATTEPVKQVQPPKATTEPVKQVQPPKATTEPVPPIKTPPSAAISTASKIGKVAVGVGLAGLLMKAESSDYNQLVIPTKEYRKEMPQKANLTGMTIKGVLDYQNEMIKSKKYPSSAVGKYQIIRKTLESAVDYFKKKPDSGITLNTNFDETTQDKIYREYLISGKRKAVEDYVTGKKTGPDALIAAQLDMAEEFASFSVPEDINRPADPKGNWDARLVKKGESYYIGDKGGNKASVTPEMSAKALNEERLLRSPDKTTPVLPTPSSASVAQSSIQNKDLKQSMDKPPIQTTNNTMVNVPSSTTIQPSVNKDDDRPPILNKR